MTLSLRGLEGLKKQLRVLDAELRPTLLRSAMRASFKSVQEAAKQKVPADTGELREAIGIAYAKGSSDTSGAVGLVVLSTSTRAKQARMAAAIFGEAQSKRLPPSRRWHFIELGTARKAARPFLRPALDENAQRVINELGREVSKKVAAAVKKGRRK